jgi:hypothetical protein
VPLGQRGQLIAMADEKRNGTDDERIVCSDERPSGWP